MRSWDELSLAEKSNMIGAAIRQGITNLPDIRQKYNEFAEGGSIHIDPSKKGTFTAAASRHGKSVQEFASQVLAHPENYSPAMRKKANFARNAAKWKHGLGGNLFDEGSYLDIAKKHIKKNEGFVRTPVKDGPANTNWRSVGYGFNDSGFFNKYPGGISKHYEKGITREQAEQELDWMIGNIDADLRRVYGNKWDNFNDNQKAAIIDTYYQRPASVKKASKFYKAIMSDNPAAADYLGVDGFKNRNKDRRNLFGSPVTNNTPLFMPSNPEAFFTPLSAYEQPVMVEQEEPHINALFEIPGVDYEKALEKEERAERNRKLNFLLSMLNPTPQDNIFNQPLLFTSPTYKPAENMPYGPLVDTTNIYDEGGTKNSKWWKTNGKSVGYGDDYNILYNPTPSDIAEGLITYNAGIAPVTVNGKGKEQPKQDEYRWATARTPQLTFSEAAKGVEAATGPLLHWAQPSQYVGAVRDAVNGKNPLTSMLRGNSGVVPEEYAQEHPWLSTAFNLGTDAFVLSGGPQRTIGIANNLRPQNLRNHVYVAKAPIGYDGLGEAVRRGVKNVLSGRPADIESPEWFNRESAEILQNYAPKVDGLSEAEYADYLKNYGERALKARADMWRLYNKIPQKYGTFTPSTRHPGAYTDIEGIKSLKAIPPQILGENQIDFINSVGGNVGKPTIMNLGRGIPDAGYTGQNFGVTITSDLWDLHPFSRPTDRIIPKYIKPTYKKYIGDPLRKTGKAIKNVSDRLRYNDKEINDYLAANKNDEFAMEMFDPDMFPTTGLKRKVGDLLYNTSRKINKVANTPEFNFLKPLEQKIADFEIGKLVGSKPVLVQYDIPWTANRKLTIGSDGMPYFTVEYTPGFHSNNIFPEEVMRFKNENVKPWDASKDRTFNMFTNLIPR